MTPIQIILIVSCLACFVFYIRFAKSIIVDRIVAIVMLSGSVSAIIFHEYTTKIANLLGVGRGVDLFFYIFIVSVAFTFIVMFRRISQLEHDLSKLVREQALQSDKLKEGN